MKSFFMLIVFSLSLCASNTTIEPKKKVTIHSVLENKKRIEERVDDSEKRIKLLKKEIKFLKGEIKANKEEHQSTFKKNMLVVMLVVAISITFSLLSFIFAQRYKNRMEVKLQEALFMINGEKEKIDRFLDKTPYKEDATFTEPL